MQIRKNLIFYTPLVYSVYTRNTLGANFLRFLFHYVLPLLLLVICYPSFSGLRFLLGILYIYNAYEVGYIQNDCETIKLETNPTMRVSPDDLSFYESRKYRIYFSRFFIHILLSYVIIKMNWGCLPVLLTCLLFPIFYIYNILRQYYVLYIHLVLMYIRFSVPAFLAVNGLPCSLVLGLLFINPLISFIELSVKGKFGYQNKFFKKFILSDYKYIHSFRIKYYSFFSAFFFIMYIVENISISIPLSFCFMSIFSLITYLCKKRHSITNVVPKDVQIR